MNAAFTLETNSALKIDCTPLCASAFFNAADECCHVVVLSADEDLKLWGTEMASKTIR
jgi:hypothetical protein